MEKTGSLSPLQEITRIVRMVTVAIKPDFLLSICTPAIYLSFCQLQIAYYD